MKEGRRGMKNFCGRCLWGFIYWGFHINLVSFLMKNLFISSVTVK